MTRTQKLVFVFLALIALVFVALIVWGGTRPGCTGSRQACAAAYSPGAAMKAMGRLFSGFGPKVKLPRDRYEFTAATTVRVDIARSDESRMRTLKLRRVQGDFALSLVNVDRRPELSGQEEANPLPKPASGSDDGHTQTFAVSPGGATLTIACLRPPCVLAAD